MDAKQTIEQIATNARVAAGVLATTTGDARNAALRKCAEAIRASSARIISENAKDLALSDEFGLTSAMVKRLTLDETKIEKMANALDEMVAQVDPVGRAITAYNRPNVTERVFPGRVPVST